MKHKKLDELGFALALLFLVPSVIADKFPRQEIPGLNQHVNLEQQGVDQISGITDARKSKLADQGIFTKRQFYDAAKDPSRVQLVVAAATERVVNEFVDMVDNLENRKHLAEIP